jgi:pilus assembly protein Flp/PilA
MLSLSRRPWERLCIKCKINQLPQSTACAGATPLRPLSNERGQGLIEYLIIVALMGVATIAIVRSMGQTVSSRFASVTFALQGEKRSATAEAVDDSQFKKKDLGNFFDGVGSSNRQKQ